MKQSVNLYRGELVSVKQKLTLARLCAGLAVVAICTFVFVSVTGWQQGQTQAESNVLSEQLEASNNELTKLRSRLTDRKQNSKLVAKKKKLQAYIQDARAFRRSISDFETSASAAVAPLLKELAEITPEGIWLDNFGLNGEGLYLSGYAVDSGELVLWMDKFEQSEVLASKRFAVVELSRSKAGYQFFQLRTQRLEGTEKQ